MINRLLILSIIICQFACNSSQDSIEPNGGLDHSSEHSIFDTVWHAPLMYSDQQDIVMGHDKVFLFNDNLISFGDLYEIMSIYAYDKHTGAVDWYYEYEGWDNTDVVDAYQSEHLLTIVTGKRVLGFDLIRREIIWEISMRVPVSNWTENPGVIYEGKFYLPALFAYQSMNEEARMIEIDIHSGAYRTVISHPMDSAGRYDYSAPCIWEDSQSDRKYMCFNIFPGYDIGSPNEQNQNIACYDYNTGDLIWEQPHFTNNYPSNANHPPVIYEDLVITGGDYSIYAFDVHTGELRWSHKEGDKFGLWTNTAHFLKKDRLYINSVLHEVSCLDPATGALIWTHPRGGANCANDMSYHPEHDYLVFTSWGRGSIVVLDGLTGEELHEEHLWDRKVFTDNVVYDEETDAFYTTTYQDAICFRLRARE